jgi:uncharacterized Tic20 family protein
MEETFREPDQNARNWGMLAHLLTLLGYVIGFGHFIPPLVIYLTKKDEHEFIADQARESLNFQISIFILTLLCLPLVCILIGIPLLIALFFYHLIATIVASVRASEGKRFRYPITFRLIS